jgi:hypothetical protein
LDTAGQPRNCAALTVTQTSDDQPVNPEQHVAQGVTHAEQIPWEDDVVQYPEAVVVVLA